GERIALVGPNGAGKTTLAKNLCGLRTPCSGSVLYQGQQLIQDHLQRSRLEIGLLFQDPDDQLLGHTLIDDVSFGPRNQGASTDQARHRADSALKRVGLDHLAYKPPHNLSFGQKKRAALAGLLAMDPKALILDEPTANLDPEQEEIFLDLLSNFPGTIICISHDLIFLFELCSRAVVLEQGCIKEDTSLPRLVSRRSSLREMGLDFSFRFSGFLHQRGPGHTSRVAKKNPPLAPPSRLEDRQQGGESEEEGFRADTGHRAYDLALEGAVGSGQSASHAPSTGDKDPRDVFIELQGLSYTYPDGTRALQDIDLTLQAREQTAIVGENGAGKSTLLSCLLGLRPARGRYLFSGIPVTTKRRRELWQKVGMVFQDCADQLFCPSVAEEVGFGLEHLGLKKKEIRPRVEAALKQVQLQGYEERVPLHLSGGERKRLALACVLAMDPELLILDEPTAGLDPSGQELVIRILRGLHCAILLVSHDMFVIRELTERTLLMHQGRIVQDTSTAAFLQDASLAGINGLGGGYREKSSRAIYNLQHEHEHSHQHRHVHDHGHWHQGQWHSHEHEHVHEHSHQFVHVHPHPGNGHDHKPRPGVHDHDHPGHEEEGHDHQHSHERN
ncbi:MAG: energy-coupling factor ABC transporter ATP-binding protein, partial [Desulfovermiculus sp.]|nr:energy-coupling factor ABC transporter ATP-binding protein [Desulfovermiculus sp.]